MTQIAIVQPAAPQPTPAGPPASSGSQQFSSHFEKAISNKKEVNSRESEPGKSPDKLKGEEKTPAHSIDNAGQKTGPANLPDEDVASEDAAVPMEDENTGMQNPLQDLIAASSSEDQSAAIVLSYVPPANSTTSSSSTNTAASGQGVTLALSQITTQAFLASSLASQENTALASPSFPEETTTALPLAGQKPATDTMLAQLQQLIENSDEKGTVIITREDTPPPAQARGIQMAWPQQAVNGNSSQINFVVTPESDATTEFPHVMLADGWNTPVEKSDQQVTSLRQNAQQQYYEAKINLQSFGKNEDGTPQDHQQGNESTAQAQAAAGQTSSTATSLTVDQTNTFAQTLSTAQNSPTQPATEAAKIMTLPSGTVVYEEDVIRQVMERFQITRKPLDTQINIKLHPAELGELKIDLTVKEGSIRANVVAQSQHVQEIIEKNMTKLRTVLEDHGFTIEKITVTSKSDSTTDADLFDRQLFSQNEYTPQSKKRRHEAEAAFRLDEAFFPAQPATIGVNVKI